MLVQEKGAAEAGDLSCATAIVEATTVLVQARRYEHAEREESPGSGQYDYCGHALVLVHGDA